MDHVIGYKVRKVYEEAERKRKWKEDIRAERGTWARQKVNGSSEYFTVWGVACIVAQERGKAGEDALEAASFTHLDEVRAACKDGNLQAIDESGKVTNGFVSNEYIVITPKNDILEWARTIYPLIQPLAKKQDDGYLPPEPKEKHKYESWQEAVDREYKKTPRLRHTDICRRLAGELGVDSETIRRWTKNPRSK